MDEGGRISIKIATFPELMGNDVEFQKLMATTAVEEEEEKAEDLVNEDETEKARGKRYG